VLVHGYAMSQRHAAEVLRISVSTLREHLARGMERLRNDLKDHDDD
jgi:DNA-directed RNA polymerase specialized sigma24 family protein